MANGENLSKPKSVKIDCGLFEYINGLVEPPVNPKEFSKFIRAAILFSADTFKSCPLHWNMIWDQIEPKYIPMGPGFTTTISFRLPETIDSLTLKVVQDLKSDFTTLVTRSILFYLPYYRLHPESMRTIYTRWIESLSNNCVTALGQRKIPFP